MIRATSTHSQEEEMFDEIGLVNGSSRGLSVLHNLDGAWKMVQLESLLAALVDSKVVAMKAGRTRYHRPPDSPARLSKAGSQSPDSHRHHRHHHHHHHHYHHHHHHHHHRHKRGAKSKTALCNADGSTLVLTGRPDVAETDFCNGSLEEEHCANGCSVHTKLRLSDDRYVTLDMEDTCERPRRKRRKKRAPIIYQQQKTKVRDPVDLPKRARWTIIITAGFLLLTCMLLVGITLRMAPIIDQMVRNENEQLMNSLNRQDFNESLLA
ncbi:uncharacterized protein LOC124369419 [Homalodisca vitripennis]|uniref:uncharacterized protein LOC124369419 n=1 Tax=Homalodisca vitripennis TaxID=197043 RepID=UPI001EEAA3E0|nr:uncharacterized protein LOC124369419 [Homalodisca vitripennis]